MTTPNIFTVSGRLKEVCKGENGHQKGAGLYSVSPVVSDDSLAIRRFHHMAGPELSYNGYCDMDRLLQTMTHAAAALEVNKIGPRAIALAVKHGNCCGGAYNDTPERALQDAVIGDLRALYGGSVMLNFRVTKECAEILIHFRSEGRRLLSAVIAPSFDGEAIDILKGKSNKIALYANPALENIDRSSLDTSKRFRHVRGGFLVQDNYTFVPHLLGAQCVGPRLIEHLLADLAFAWAINATSNSNTITLVKDAMLVGNGVGQQDRVGAAELAIKRAKDSGHTLHGSVACSDSFFPFSDGPLHLIQAGIRTILSTSGSIRDVEVRAVCEARDTTLLLIPDSDARGFFGH